MRRIFRTAGIVTGEEGWEGGWEALIRPSCSKCLAEAWAAVEEVPGEVGIRLAKTDIVY
jgi:hypothetical protein